MADKSGPDGSSSKCTEKIDTNNAAKKVKVDPKNVHVPGSGIRQMETSPIFRAVNFELYTRPNKFVMGIGLVAITGCVGFLAYMNAMAENKRDAVYFAVNEDGSESLRLKTSKWD